MDKYFLATTYYSENVKKVRHIYVPIICYFTSSIPSSRPPSTTHCAFTPATPVTPTWFKPKHHDL